MFYIFDKNTGLCICSSPIAVNIDGTTAVETDVFYNTWEIQLVNGEIKPYSPQTYEPDDEPQTNNSIPTLVYRVRHGDTVFTDEHPMKSYDATIVSFQMADGTFNSPNVGAVVEKPEMPMFFGRNYSVGINSEGIAYCRTDDTTAENTISGWITVVLTRKQVNK